MPLAEELEDQRLLARRDRDPAFGRAQRLAIEAGVENLAAGDLDPAGRALGQLEAEMAVAQSRWRKRPRMSVRRRNLPPVVMLMTLAPFSPGLLSPTRCRWWSPQGRQQGPRQMLSSWVTSNPPQGVMSVVSATAIAGISAPQP
jgi:hypothetical protein